VPVPPRESAARDDVPPAALPDPRPAEPVVFGPVEVDPTALPAVVGDKLEVTASGRPVTTVQVRGELLQETATGFTDAVAHLADDPDVREVVVDLAATTFMDSTGLGTLVSLRNRVLVRGARFALTRPDDRVFRLFELTRLDSVFDFVDRPAQAAARR
jgi:anti-sigma B factor antagonist